MEKDQAVEGIISLRIILFMMANGPTTGDRANALYLMKKARSPKENLEQTRWKAS